MHLLISTPSLTAIPMLMSMLLQVVHYALSIAAERWTLIRALKTPKPTPRNGQLSMEIASMKSSRLLKDIVSL